MIRSKVKAYALLQKECFPMFAGSVKDGLLGSDKVIC